MKNLIIYFVFKMSAILPFTTTAQSLWVLQHTTGLQQSEDPQLVFSAVESYTRLLYFAFNNF